MIVLALVLFLAAAALLAGVESALIGVSRVRVRHAADEGDRCAAVLAQLLERRQDLLRAAMMAHHFCSIMAFAIIAVLCQSGLGPWGIPVAVLVATPVLLIGLELAPKSMFRLFPFRLLRRLTVVLRVLHYLALPGRLFTRPAIPAESATPADPREGVASLVDSILSLRLLPRNAAALLMRYATLIRLCGRDLATPFVPSAAIGADMTLAAALKDPAWPGRRHHPVVDPKGTLVGIVDAAGVPPDPAPERLVRQFAQPPARVTPNQSALRCIQILRMAVTPVAGVTEQDGSVTGLVTLETLLERLMNISEKPKTPAPASAPR